MGGRRVLLKGEPAPGPRLPAKMLRRGMLSVHGPRHVALAVGQERDIATTRMADSS